MTDADPRVLFAAERTLLAWIRTGIAMMGLGFVVARLGLFLHEFSGMRDAVAPAASRPSLWAGTLLVLLGAGLNLIGAFEYAHIIRRLRTGSRALPERPIQLAIGVAVLLAIGGLAGAIYLLSS